MTIDRKQTFTNIINNFGKLKQSQVDSFNLIFDEYEKLGWTDKRHLSYLIATCWHETARTMQPIEEWGKGKGKAYSKVENGKVYYGRGHVQITWLANYKKLTKANLKGWDFVNVPELLLQNEPSIWATFYGMRTGLFTGKKLSDYFNDTKTDPVGARRIINGQDCAHLIEVLYNKFYNSIV